MDLYAQNVMDHYHNPHNTGEINKPTVRHNELNASCGDSISVDLVITEQMVTDIKFKGSGCAISQAAISILTDYVKQKSVDEILALTDTEIKEMLGVPISYRREKCALLGLLAIKNAILTWQGQQVLQWYDISSELADE